LEKARAEDAAQSPAGVVGPHRKIERRIEPMLLQQRREPRHAVLGPAQRIDIDLEADVSSLKHRATTTPKPTAGCARRNRKSPTARSACRSSASSRARRSYS